MNRRFMSYKERIFDSLYEMQSISLFLSKKEIYKERKVFLSLVKDCKATAQLCNARLLARNLANKLCLAVFLNLFSAAKLGT